MKLTVQLALTLLLIVASLVSVTSIVVESSNYDLYYWQGSSAILDSTGNNTQLISVRVTRDLVSSEVLILTNVSATNPSGYQGFILHGFDLTVEFLHAGNLSQSIFWAPNNLQSGVVLDKPLAPQTTFHASIPLLLNPTESNAYQSFNQTYGGNVEAHCVLTTKVTSFLDPVYGIMTTQISRDLQVS